MWWSAVVEVRSLSGMRKYMIFLPTEQVLTVGEGLWHVSVSFIPLLNLSFLGPLRPKSLRVHQMCFNHFKIL